MTAICCCAAVCDFGISKMKDASLAASSTRLQAGTPAYMVRQGPKCTVQLTCSAFNARSIWLHSIFRPPCQSFLLSGTLPYVCVSPRVLSFQSVCCLTGCLPCCCPQAPEQFEGCSVTDKVDVFAFGVLLWECFEQQQPWKELSPMQIIYSVGLQVGLKHQPWFALRS